MNWRPARDVVWTSTLHARQPQQRVRAAGAGGIVCFEWVPTDGTSRASVSRKCIGNCAQDPACAREERLNPPELRELGGPSELVLPRLGERAWVLHVSCPQGTGRLREGTGLGAETLSRLRKQVFPPRGVRGVASHPHGPVC